MVSLKRLKHLRSISKLGGEASKRAKKPPLQRFNENYFVDDSGCWIWTGYKSRGYGSLKVNGKAKKATRWSFEYFNKIRIKSTRLFVCHKCDVRACVNPDHLFLGTNKDNMIDALQKGFLPTGEKHYACKLLDDDILKIKRLKEKGDSAKDISIKYNVTAATIYRICKGTHRSSQRNATNKITSTK